MNTNTKFCLKILGLCCDLTSFLQEENSENQREQETETLTESDITFR